MAVPPPLSRAGDRNAASRRGPDDRRERPVHRAHRGRRRQRAHRGDRSRGQRCARDHGGRSAWHDGRARRRRTPARGQRTGRQLAHDARQRWRDPHHGGRDRRAEVVCGDGRQPIGAAERTDRLRRSGGYLPHDLVQPSPEPHVSARCLPRQDRDRRSRGPDPAGSSSDADGSGDERGGSAGQRGCYRPARESPARQAGMDPADHRARARARDSGRRRVRHARDRARRRGAHCCGGVRGAPCVRFRRRARRHHAGLRAVPVRRCGNDDRHLG